VYYTWQNCPYRWRKIDIFPDIHKPQEIIYQ
jgi:hypothetical protein